MNMISRNLPLMATAFVAMLLYAAAAYRFENFATLSVFVNILTDTAFLGIAAVGMTLVIISGGIDLSVGAVIGFTSVAMAVALEELGFLLPAVIAGVLIIGTLFGALQGTVIQYLQLPAFLVTLAGMFLMRGFAFIISMESIGLEHPGLLDFAFASWEFTEGTYTGWVPAFLLAAVAGGFIISNYTHFGRSVYALGSKEPAAFLMGVKIARTRIGVYAFSGFCAALAGIVYTIYSQSGNATAGTTLELDAIAVTVIGGTLLTGGYGSVIGTFLGILIYGIIQTAITFDGTLSSSWTKIAVATLLLLFIALQKLITASLKR